MSDPSNQNNSGDMTGPVTGPNSDNPANQTGLESPGAPPLNSPSVPSNPDQILSQEEFADLFNFDGLTEAEQQAQAQAEAQAQQQLLDPTQQQNQQTPQQQIQPDPNQMQQQQLPNQQMPQQQIPQQVQQQAPHLHVVPDPAQQAQPQPQGQPPVQTPTQQSMVSPQDQQIQMLTAQLAAMSQELTNMRAAQSQPQPQQQAQPGQQPGQGQVPSYQFQIPQPISDAIASEDSATRGMAIQQLLASYGQSMHQQITQSVREEMQQTVPQMVQPHIEQATLAQAVQTDFYGKYPQLDNPAFKHIITQAGNEVMAETGIRQWGPQLRDMIFQRVSQRLGGFASQGQPILPVIQPGQFVPQQNFQAQPQQQMIPQQNQMMPQQFVPSPQYAVQPGVPGVQQPPVQVGVMSRPGVAPDNSIAAQINDLRSA